jgi:hypothetical protein
MRLAARPVTVRRRKTTVLAHWVILLDWTLPGTGPACWDLCWYLALNRARLPEPKEAVIARYRSELENHGSQQAAGGKNNLTYA